MSDDEPVLDAAEQVDAMERRVLGQTQDPVRDDSHTSEDGPEPADPAFAIDLEPEDQGTADAAAESSG